MVINLELFDLGKMLGDAAKLGAKQALIEAGLSKPFLSATKAHSIYGRKTIERWVREGLIIPHKDGERNSAVRFDSLLLETLSKSSNHLSYFNSQN